MNLSLFRRRAAPGAPAAVAAALLLSLPSALPLAAQTLSSPLGAPAAAAGGASAAPTNAPGNAPGNAPANASSGAPANASSGAPANASSGAPLASPVPAPVAGSGGAANSGTGGGSSATVPHGQGAGVHSPLSPYAPLKPRDDVVAWSVLTDVKTRIENRRIVPVYPASVQALDQKKIRLQGFMMPLGPGEQQRHFLLASVPLTCAFCTPGGPESMVEVRTVKPVKYSMEAVVVEGRFHVLKADPYGLYYRFTEAVGVPK